MDGSKKAVGEMFTAIRTYHPKQRSTKNLLYIIPVMRAWSTVLPSSRMISMIKLPLLLVSYLFVWMKLIATTST